jgi:hypothetical protein
MYTACGGDVGVLGRGDEYDGAVFSVGESCNVLLLGALGTGESWLADASGCIAEVGVAWLHKRGSPHSQLHTTISCTRTHHDHFTLTHSQCAHFRVLHLCIHVPFYKCTRPSYNGTESNRTLEEYSTTPPTKIIMHYKPSEPC